MTADEDSSLRDNIRRLRTARGLSQVQLADAAGLSRVGLRYIEAGTTRPRAETIVAIAQALGVAVESLHVQTRALRKVRFRAQKKMTTREEVLANVARQLHSYRELEQLLGQRRSTRLAEVRAAVSKLRGDHRAVEAAALTRRALGLGEEDLIRDVCGLLEDNQIKVLTPSVASEGFFGLSVGDDEAGPAVVVNTWDRISVERWIFTAAHELGHLVLHLGAYDASQSEEDEREEREADVFASHVLMPEKVFRKELAQAWGLSWLDRVFKLKRLFRVSYRTVLYRIANDLPADQKKKVWIRFNVEYRRRTSRPLPGTIEPDGLPPDAFFRRPPDKSADEPERLDRHDFMQDRLTRLVRHALEAKKITSRRAAEILEIDAAQMLDLAESWDE